MGSNMHIDLAFSTLICRWSYVLCLFECSGFLKFSGSNAAKPQPASDEDIFQDNSSHLHRLVSEGDVKGVRFVQLITCFPFLTFFWKAVSFVSYS